MTFFDDVAAFHRAFGVEEKALPGPPLQQRVDLRRRLIREEYRELLEEIWRPEYAMSMVGLAKEIADLIVVLLGTADEFGLPFNEVWAVVHASNMAKTDTPDRSMRRDGKLLKPPGWVDPKHAIEAILAGKKEVGISGRTTTNSDT